MAPDANIPPSTGAEKDTDAVLSEAESRLRPLTHALQQAWWDANVSSSEATESQRHAAELEVRAVLADAEMLASVERALAGATVGSVPHRQLDRLRCQMVPNQLDEATRRALVNLETRVESSFNTHRGEIDGTRVDDNEIANILAESSDPELRRKAWEASKSIGSVVAADVLELVRLRNETARRLGFDDHYTMALRLDELDEARLLATLDEVAVLTNESFAAWKAEEDSGHAARFGCTVDDLRPWHYDDAFFQEPPGVDGVDLDAYFADADIESLTVRTYDGIGLDIRKVLAASDLYGREGKCQHAFCIDVDRAGDVRVLCNVTQRERWMETMLHEFGHAVYDCGIDHDLPWLLHGPAHMLTTEAVAMMFGRLARDPEWLTDIAGVDANTLERTRAAIGDAVRAGALVFARWALVMCHFERSLYGDPDGDHNARWWDLVERFQLIQRPDDRDAPDWAAKIHLAVAPVYYQNYLYGELMASQLRAALARDAGGIVDVPQCGAWLAARVFAPGASRRWDHLIEHATGDALTASHFASELAIGG